MYVIARAAVKFGINFMSCSVKLHEAQPSAILPSSLQRVEFIPKFTPARAITIAYFEISDFQIRFHAE